MFADFRIANSQGTAVSMTRRPRNSQPHCQRSILRVHGKAQPQQSSTAENWLAGPEKNTDSADGTGPAFRGIRKLADSQRESTENSGIFSILRSVQSSLFPCRLVRPMQTGVARLGSDGGNRCRRCAAQDRRHQSGAAEEHNIELFRT